MNKQMKVVMSYAVGAIVALAAPATFAVNLDIWGVAHASVDSTDNGLVSDTYVASNSSRLGFSGDQDLGNGLKVFFRYESGVDLTGQGGNDGNGTAVPTGAGSVSGGLFTNTRDAWVGISGGFGTVRLGRVGGLNQWVYDYNLFGDQVGDLGNIWGGNGLAGRLSSAVQYSRGFGDNADLTVTFAPDDGTSDTATSVVKVNFKAANVKIGVALMSQGTGTGTPEQDATAVTASYSFGNVTVGGGFQSESDIGGTAGNDADSVTVGATWKMGKGTFKVQFTSLDSDTVNGDAEQLAVGYDYSVGKNTTVYVAYATTDNDPAASFSATNYGHGDNVVVAAGQDPSSVSIGVVYKFKARVR